MIVGNILITHVGPYKYNKKIECYMCFAHGQRSSIRCLIAAIYVLRQIYIVFLNHGGETNINIYSNILRAKHSPE